MGLQTVDLNQCEWSCVMRMRPAEPPFEIAERLGESPDCVIGHMVMEITTTDAVYEQVSPEDNVWIDINTGDVVHMDHTRLRVDDA